MAITDETYGTRQRLVSPISYEMISSLVLVYFSSRIATGLFMNVYSFILWPICKTFLSVHYRLATNTD